MNIKISICLLLLGFAPAASASMIDTAWAAKSSGFIGANDTLTFENYLIKAKTVDATRAIIEVYKDQNKIEQKEFNTNGYREYNNIRVTLLGIWGQYAWVSISKPENKVIWRPAGNKILKWGEKYEFMNYTLRAESFGPESVNLTISGKNTYETRSFSRDSYGDYGNLRIAVTNISQDGFVGLDFLTYSLPAVKASISTDKEEYYPDENVQVTLNTASDVDLNIEGITLESSANTEMLPATFSATNATGTAYFRSRIKQSPENSTVTITATIMARDYYGNEYSNRVSKAIHIMPVVSITKWAATDTDEQNVTVDLFIYNGGSTEESISVYDTVYDEKNDLKQLNWTIKLKPGVSSNIEYPAPVQKVGQYILPPAMAKWKKNTSSSKEAVVTVHGPLVVITKSAAKGGNLLNVKLDINNTGDRPAIVNLSDKISAGQPVVSGVAAWSGMLAAGEHTAIIYSLPGDIVSLPAASAIYRDIHGVARQAQSNTVEISGARNNIDTGNTISKMSTESPLKATPDEILSFMVSSFAVISGIFAGVAVAVYILIRLKRR
ncbi:Uncharacterised protein [uncultured archaeon]|nr:Uncharacterised protein [uncultured archaeon]